ncbi:MAG: response regulator [Calditrichaeota bacterium]|nr:MAG: response regulator [Calditrichota bacterium]MBL1204256.1 response regulator [Calditrichota bacterium]NOG44086.1 cyclic nucleotide-binding domain-containing protein [Calditrichota bacterium]
MIQIGKIIKKVPIFRMLGKESIDFIVERLKFKTFAAGEAICKTGDKGEEMYIIISGETDVQVGEPGKEVVVATLKSGDYFGEMSLLTDEPRSATVLSNDGCETFVLYKNDFDVILERFPSIALSMTKIVSQRLSDTNKKAAKLPKPEDIDTKGGKGPTGDIKDIALVDLISFCESNSLTGTMNLVNGANKGHFEFQRGNLISVKLGDVTEDEALDTMLGWNEGKFDITVSPLNLGIEAEESDEVETKSILIVNNSLVVRKVIERAFKGLGYIVDTASNVANSMEKAGSLNPDLIISDVKLSDGNGVDFINKVREEKDLPFIFITDDSIKAEFEGQIKQLGNAELTKTHEVSEIVKLVENTLL